jgi:hypothetical protein
LTTFLGRLLAIVSCQLPLGSCRVADTELLVLTFDYAVFKVLAELGVQQSCVSLRQRQVLTPGLAIPVV